MADITNPQTIRWVGEVVRPLAETLRAVNVACEQTMAEWYAGINATVPNDTSDLADGREDEGVSRLTGADINSFLGQVAAIQAVFDVAGVVDVINKPCVRSLEVR